MLLKTWGTSEVLNGSAIEEIYGKALRVLKDIGVRVENKWMVDRLVSHGAESKEPFVVTFPEHLMDDMVRNAVPFDWETVPELSFTAGANPQYYMAAGTDYVCENTLASIERLTKLADRLEHVSRIHLMGAASDVLPALTPLYARVIGWKYIANTKFDCCEIWDDDTIDYISEMVDEYKAGSGQTENGNLLDAVVYLISPLCFKAMEADRFEKCYKKGFNISVSSLCSAGGTAPVTLAGALVQNLAELLFVNLLDKVFYDNKRLVIGNRIGIMDMKSAMFPYGRPEIGITNLAMGNIARHLKAEYISNSFSADAKLPSSEAGMQKSMSAITGILAGSTNFYTMGLLSIDEIVSEEQLVIDNEFVGMLKRLAKGFELDEETMAFDVIKEVGPGGLYTATEHTLLNYRTEHWQPEIFSREMYGSWVAKGKRTDRDLAAKRVQELLAKEQPFGISVDAEMRLLAIVDRAKNKLENR
jgi:trimethylamine--corrinoid protein Co-methyltransferase